MTHEQLIDDLTADLKSKLQDARLEAVAMRYTENPRAYRELSKHVWRQAAEIDEQLEFLHNMMRCG
jgi:hypothetical protein